MGTQMIPTFREILPQLGAMIREHGGLGVLLVDLVPLGRIERGFGAGAFQALRAQMDAMMVEMKDCVRDGDVLARHEREGDRFLIFLGGRRTETAFECASLRKLADRVEARLRPRLARATHPYLRERPVLDVGHAFVLHTPLESEERQIVRLIDEAMASAQLREQVRQRDEREGLLNIIYNRQVWTAFQPILEIQSKHVVGHEGLSRGPRGTDLESPAALFGLARAHGVVEELERACRRQAFVDWQLFGASGRLFINTVPATVRDPTFLGRGVLDFLGPHLPPRLVTLEITEHEVIENLNLYREAMHAFTELGFSFAIDDLGAGYSGLETVATLGASYLKIDMTLIRDVHQKPTSQQVIKAILELAAGVGATVIAEGIETVEEARALVDLGVRFGQGYLYGRPVDPYAARPPVAVSKA
jgi:EAL domain-containing protein (putative c-di-GMP-specific phosphodiesterase class I)